MNWTLTLLSDERSHKFDGWQRQGLMINDQLPQISNSSCARQNTQQHVPI
jgi:hypothetical protein